MKKYLSFLILVLLFFVMQCSKEDMTSPQDNLRTGEMVFDESDTDYYQGALAKGNADFANEIRLKYFAKALAKNLANPGACKLLKQEIGKKFDGDYDVLWEAVRDENISGKGKFRKLISDRLSKGKGSFISIDDVEEVPLLQVSLPVNFEDWDGEEPILVAYTPLTIDDIEVEEIYAYDSEGNEYIIDAETPPDFPLIVVGINERVDPVTKKLHFRESRSPLALPAVDDGGGGGGGGGGSGSSSSAGYYPYITKINLSKHPKHYEPWYAGEAELYCITYVINTSTYHKEPYLSKDFDYSCWVLTWTGWHSSTPWRSWNHKIDPGYPNYISLIEIWEYDPLGHDGLMHDPWYEWDCDHLEDWPLIRDAINFLCDIIQNVFNWGGNDDLVGGVAYLSLLETEQTFEGTGLDIKMKLKFCD